MRTQTVLLVLAFLLAVPGLVAQGSAPAVATPGPGGGLESSHAAAPAPAGTVSGTIVDDSGQPLADCLVQLENVVPVFKRTWREVNPDAGGHFRFANVAWGTYNVGSVCGWYPESLNSLYAGRVRQTVTLSPGSAVTEVNIVRKDKAGVITKINVFDGMTGRRITRTDPGSGNELDAFSEAIYRADNPKFGLRGSLGATILVPAQIPVIVKIWAEGYSTWYYGGASDLEHAKPLVLQPGQKISLDVVLQPLRPQ